jgi:hypothetical protein
VPSKKKKFSNRLLGWNYLAIGTLEMEDTPLGAKEYILFIREDLPNVIKASVGLRNILNQGVVSVKGAFLQRDIAEFILCAHEKALIWALGEGSDHRSVGHGGKGPIGTVVFQDAFVIAEIHNSPVVLIDAPVLSSGSILRFREVNGLGRSQKMRLSC